MGMLPMHAYLIRALFSLAIICAMGPVIAAAQSLTDEELVAMLKGGGYNIYVRHASTVWSQSDKVNSPDDWNSCDPGKVRQLSDEGRREARALGEALQANGIPLGRIVSSPYCRARDTARLISGEEPEATSNLMNLRVEELVGGRDAAVSRARNLLSEPPVAGKNDLFAAHGNLGRAALGPYLGEGELMVIRPRGNGQLEVLGTLSLSDLQSIAR